MFNFDLVLITFSYSTNRVIGYSALDRVVGYFAILICFMVFLAAFRLGWGMIGLFLSNVNHQDFMDLIKSFSLLIILGLIVGYVAVSLIG